MNTEKQKKVWLRWYKVLIYKFKTRPLRYQEITNTMAQLTKFWYRLGALEVTLISMTLSGSLLFILALVASLQDGP